MCATSATRAAAATTIRSSAAAMREASQAREHPGYPGMFVSRPETAIAPATLRALEILWQDDATAFVLGPPIPVGIDAIADVDEAGGTVQARRIDVGELLALAEAPPEGVELGGTARVAFAVVALARRSVAEGLVHPQVAQSGGTWFAFWGPVLDDVVREALTQIESAAPPAFGHGFGGDAEGAGEGLYAVRRDP